MKEFKLPELGENISSASVLKISVKSGDYIETDQTVLEIETDKATIEVPSTVSGKITEILIKEGEKAEVGQVILRIEDNVEEIIVPPKAVTIDETVVVPEKEVSTNATQTQTEVSAESKVVDFILPELGENIAAADILKILVKVGDTVQKDQGVLEIETDKATIEVPSTISGKITEIFIKEGEKAKVGSAIFRAVSEVQIPKSVTVSKEPGNIPAVISKTEVPLVLIKGVTPNKPAVLVDNQPPIKSNSAPAAPSVRRLAREIGVDINQVPGSGPGGRISLDDVKAFSKKLHENKAAMQTSVQFEAKFQPLPDFSKYGETETKAMSGIRTKTAEHLSYAWHTIPHVTQFDKADVTSLEEWRKQFNPYFEKNGTKLTVTAILVKILTTAMKVFPQFNSSIDMEKKEVIYKKYFNVGVAVDTEHGLMVPVIKNADKLNLLQISQEINLLAEKARNRKVSLEDLQGGCITITNLGGIGGTHFTPIVNSPEVSILGVSRSSYEQVYINGKFETRLMLPLSLSCVHRIIDGADGIRFLRWVIEALENPMKLLIEG